MNPPRLKLPIGIQTFRKIRDGGFYYVDKTPMAWSLAQDAGYYFLSRPRRFGKSLFLDTLKELFEGNQRLFKGLFIHDLWDWQQRFPVLQISFNDGGLKSTADLERRIASILRLNFQRLGLALPDITDNLELLGELVRAASAKFAAPVVILVDEYDKPILDNLEDETAARAMREGLKAFYSVIKGLDAEIRFVFLTGVSKFSKVSLFSGLNNLRDITITSDYSAICGYTDADVEQVFAPELAGLDRAEIRRWYNGYNWLGEAVYNPFDLLLLFQDRKFRPYWFESGTPGFLVKMLAQRKTWLPTLANLEASDALLSVFDIDYISSEALMFQAGYLTLDEERVVAGKYFYKLRFPNEEVRQSLFGSLLEEWSGRSDAQTSNTISLYEILQANDLPALKDLFQAFFSSIPHQWFTKNRIAAFEGYYASVFYAYFVAAGFDIRVEDATNFGRIDMSVIMPTKIVLFEFKVVELLPTGRALQQLKDKFYADKYRQNAVPIYLVGVEFSRESRNLVGFEVELLDEPIQ
jgi:hypothetical protein